MTVTVLADLRLDPVNRTDFLKAVDESLSDTRSYEGCEGVEVVADMDDPGHIVLIERWTERSRHEAYLAWRTESGTLAEIAAMLSAEPAFTYLEPVD